MTEKNLTNALVFLDIETIPSEDNYTLREIKEEEVGEHGSLKDEEKIKEWKRKKLEELKEKEKEKAKKELHDEGLVSYKGRIFCISYAIGDGEVRNIDMLNGEKEMLESFYDDIKGYKTYTFIAHNYSFDSLFIAHRAMHFGIWRLVEILRCDHGYSKYKYIDTSELAGLGLQWKYRISLHNLCLLLGIPTSKDEMNGSDVFDYYLAKRYEEIKNYCNKDVDRTRRCYNLLK